MYGIDDLFILAVFVLVILNFRCVLNIIVCLVVFVLNMDLFFGVVKALSANLAHKSSLLFFKVCIFKAY